MKWTRVRYENEPPGVRPAVVRSTDRVVDGGPRRATSPVVGHACTLPHASASTSSARVCRSGARPRPFRVSLVLVGGRPRRPGARAALGVLTGCGPRVRVQHRSKGGTGTLGCLGRPGRRLFALSLQAAAQLTRGQVGTLHIKAVAPPAGVTRGRPRRRYSQHQGNWCHRDHHALRPRRPADPAGTRGGLGSDRVLTCSRGCQRNVRGTGPSRHK